jgi:uncharacterized protein (TIGR00159 family)
MFELFIPIFIDIRWLDIVDVLLVAILLFELYNLLRGTVAINILFGIVALFLFWQIVNALQMELLSQILGAFISVGFIALIVIFQPEIRRFLLALGRPAFIQRKNRRFLFWRINFKEEKIFDLDPIIVACQRMADNRTGALIVICRQHELDQYIDTGEVLDAKISSPLLESIFVKSGPLHDGAIIIRHQKVKAAASILPVSTNASLSRRLGLRHRAGVGITEQSDAISIMVSEETGNIAYAVEGKLTQKVQPAALKDFLEEELGFGEEPDEVPNKQAVAPKGI